MIQVSMIKPISKSKTKIGALIGGVAIVAGAIVAALDGAVSGSELISTIGIGIGAILFGVGLRDAISKN